MVTRKKKLHLNVKFWIRVHWNGPSCKKHGKWRLSLWRYRRVVLVWTFGMTRMAVKRMLFHNPESGRHFWSGKCSEWRRLMKLSDPCHIIQHHCCLKPFIFVILSELMTIISSSYALNMTPFCWNTAQKKSIASASKFPLKKTIILWGAWPLAVRRIHVCSIHVTGKRRFGDSGGKDSVGGKEEFFLGERLSWWMGWFCSFVEWILLLLLLLLLLFNDFCFGIIVFFVFLKGDFFMDCTIGQSEKQQTNHHLGYFFAFFSKHLKQIHSFEEASQR